MKIKIMNQKNIILPFILGCSLFTNSLLAQTWQPPVLTESYQGTGSGVFADKSLFTVQGFPAIAYYDDAHRNLIYTRANDINGNSWAEPQPLVITGDVGQSCIMRIVNGNPAVCYIRKIVGSSTIFDIEYIRANDAVGSSWAAPIKLISGCYNNKLGFEVIGGFPIISYNYFENGVKSINFIKANDSNGSTWSTPNIVVSTTSYGGYDDFKLIETNGNPSLCYIFSYPQKIEFIRANNTTGSSWGSPVTLATSPYVFKLGSIAIINGNPAICYADPIYYSVNYIRANDLNGSTWGTNNSLESGGYGFGLTSFLIQLNGLPTLFYTSQSNQMIHKRATDASGDNWGSSTTIANMSIANVPFQIELVNGNPATAGGSTGGYIRSDNAIGTTWGTAKIIRNSGYSGINPNVKLLNGLPSISYHGAIDVNNVGKNCIKFIQANSAGTAWSNPIVVTPTITNTSPYYVSTLNMANGKPAICFMKNGENGLKYTQAANTAGTTWNNIVTLDPNLIGDFSPNFEIVNGKPAVSYISVIGGNFDLKFVIANNSDGSTWASPQTIDVECDLYKTSLNIVNGNPAIAYSHRELNYPGQRRLKFVRASNSSGTSWNSPITLSVDGIPSYAKLMIVNGKPAIAYLDNGSIFFVSANDVNGATWNSPQLIFTDFRLLSLDFDLYGGIPIISFLTSDGTTGNKLIYTIKADNADGSSWSLPPQIAYDKSNPDGVISMAAVPTSKLGIAFFSADEQFPYYVASSIVALPVELIAFKGKNTEGGNLLTWQTASEVNTTHFDIERSYDGKQFEKIGETKAQGKAAMYEYLDKAPLSGVGGLYYRLKINDLDGKSSYTNVVTLSPKVKGFTAKVYPNPTNDMVTVSIEVEKKSDITFELKDILGRTIWQSKAENTEGSLSLPIPLTDIANGTYFLKISNGQTAKQERIIKN
jgi:Secretion system C-terminal sorting domain